MPNALSEQHTHAPARPRSWSEIHGSGELSWEQIQGSRDASWEEVHPGGGAAYAAQATRDSQEG